MNKNIIRSGKIIVAEVYQYVGGIKFSIDQKYFNQFGAMFNLDPKQKHYDNANAWADRVISIHLENTKQLKK